MSSKNKAKPFECRICGKRYVAKGSMLRHIITHSGTKNFKCHLCNMAFTRKCILEMHMSTHSQEKNFCCKICSKSFKWKESLRLHLLAHTDKKNFQCELCGKRFKRKSGVRAHMIIHTGERNYKCEVCGKTFMQKFCLQRHSTLHEREMQPAPIQELCVKQEVDVKSEVCINLPTIQESKSEWVWNLIQWCIGKLRTFKICHLRAKLSNLLKQNCHTHCYNYTVCRNFASSGDGWLDSKQ